MTKIFFPYNDQPKQFQFKFSKPIRFPFYVNDLVYFWEADAHGITLYLHNEVAPTLKNVLLEESGITMYLYNQETKVGKHIYVEFAKVGLGLYTLGDLDPLTLGYIDNFTLGEISNYAADWMMLLQSTANVDGHIYSEADNVSMHLDSGIVLPYDKKIYTGELQDKIGIIGLNSFRNMTLGELDPLDLDNIDVMLSTFRAFGSIPASLVKEIKITHTNILKNNTASPLLDFGVSATGAGMAISNNNLTANGNIITSASEVCMNHQTFTATTDSNIMPLLSCAKIACKTLVAIANEDIDILNPEESSSYIENEVVSLNILVESEEETG